MCAELLDSCPKPSSQHKRSLQSVKKFHPLCTICELALKEVLKKLVNFVSLYVHVHSNYMYVYTLCAHSFIVTKKKQLLFIKPLENMTEKEADKLCAAVPKDDNAKVCTCTCTCVPLHFCDLICAVLCVFLYIND